MTNIKFVITMLEVRVWICLLHNGFRHKKYLFAKRFWDVDLLFIADMLRFWPPARSVLKQKYNNIKYRTELSWQFRPIQHKLILKTFEFVRYFRIKMFLRRSHMFKSQQYLAWKIRLYLISVLLSPFSRVSWQEQ